MKNHILWNHNHLGSSKQTQDVTVRVGRLLSFSKPQVPFFWKKEKDIPILQACFKGSLNLYM